MSVPETATRSGAGPTDAALVVAASAGASWAREALFRRHVRAVHGLARRLLGTDTDTEDLVQECFVQALRSLDRLAEPEAFSGWLAAIVVRTTHKLLRRRYLTRRLGLRSPEPIDLDTIVSHTAPPDVAVELRALYRIIEGLPPNVRVPLVLHRVDGRSLEQIATLVGSSITIIKRRIAEGDEALRRHARGEQ